MTPLIETRALRRDFTLEKGAVVPALAAADIQIYEKEFVCIVGPSGCGKSTLLRIIAGLDSPTSGEALWRGQVITGPSSERGMVFQEYSLLPWRTVADNVALGLAFRGTSNGAVP